MTGVIDLYYKHENNKHWKYIIIRAVVFYKNELNHEFTYRNV